MIGSRHLIIDLDAGGPLPPEQRRQPPPAAAIREERRRLAEIKKAAKADRLRRIAAAGGIASAT